MSSGGHDTLERNRVWLAEAFGKVLFINSEYINTQLHNDNTWIRSKIKSIEYCTTEMTTCKIHPEYRHKRTWSTKSNVTNSIPTFFDKVNVDSFRY